MNKKLVELSYEELYNIVKSSGICKDKIKDVVDALKISLERLDDGDSSIVVETTFRVADSLRTRGINLSLQEVKGVVEKLKEYILK